MATTPPIIALPGTVKQAAPGLTGFDVNSVLTAAQALTLKNDGYTFCIRYIPRTPDLVRGNLSNAEALHILNAGLALMAVQHVAQPGWQPSASLGTQYGNYAGVYAKEIVGLPSGVNIWLDMEEVAQSAPEADVIAYCQAWYNAVNEAGYTPGVYVGYGPGLNPQQLYAKLSFKHYWRAYNGPTVATRGYQLIQKTQKNIASTVIDPNITQNDELGDAVLWLSIP